MFVVSKSNSSQTEVSIYKKKTKDQSCDFNFTEFWSSASVKMQFPTLSKLSYIVAVSQVATCSIESKFSERGRDIDDDCRGNLLVKNKTLVGKAADYFQNMSKNEMFM